MNMANQYQEQDFDYQLDTHRRADKVKESARSRRAVCTFHPASRAQRHSPPPEQAIQLVISESD